MENFLDILDGQRVYEDIAFLDSYGRIFSAIPDGSYLFIKNGKEELRRNDGQAGNSEPANGIPLRPG